MALRLLDSSLVDVPEDLVGELLEVRWAEGLVPLFEVWIAGERVSETRMLFERVCSYPDGLEFGLDELGESFVSLVVFRNALTARSCDVGLVVEV